MSPPPPPRPPTSASSSSRTVPSSPLFDAVVSAFFEQLRLSVADFSESQHWRMVGGWQAQGIPDDVIYETLQELFPFHGSPLTLYEELYVPALSGKGLTPIMAKPPLASTLLQTQQRQRQSSQSPFTRTAVRTGTAPATAPPMMFPKPPPAPGTLHQLLQKRSPPPPPMYTSNNSNTINRKVADVINVGDYVNVRAAFSQGFHSRGGNGYVACKEREVNGVDFVFTVAYVQGFLSGGGSVSATESKIMRDRLTVLPPYLALGPPKQGLDATASAELKIPMHRLASQPLKPAPFSVDRLKRQRKGSIVATESSEDDDDNNDNEDTTNTAVYSPPERLSGYDNLAEYLQKNHTLGRCKGWRQDDFADLDLALASVKRDLLLRDVMWMEHYLNQKGRRKGPKQAKDGSFCSNSFVRNKNRDSSEHNNDDDNNDNTRSEKIHPLTMRYLAYSWGVGKNTPKELLKRVNGNSRGGTAPGGSGTNNPEAWKQRSVIECRKTALKHYSAKHLYIRHRITERRRHTLHHELEKYKNEDDDDNDDASSSGSFLTYQYRKDTKEEWDALDRAAREPWEQKAKWHDEMQPSVQQILVGQINNHPYRTYNDLAMDIGDWCGASTIQRWLTAKRASSKVE
jgi:hypothetical protein